MDLCSKLEIDTDTPAAARFKKYTNNISRLLKFPNVSTFLAKTVVFEGIVYNVFNIMYNEHFFSVILNG